MMLVLRVLVRQSLHGYAIAQRIRQLSSDELSVEEGSLYPALQKLLAKGWVKAAWRQSVRDDRCANIASPPAASSSSEA